MRKLTLMLAVVLVWCLPAYAQLAGGNIHGTVYDEHGAVLPGVTVTLSGIDRTTTFTTDEQGRFRFLNLEPGSYTITTALPGFTTLVRERIVVTVGRSVELPLTMRLAEIEETITVTGESPIIDTREIGTATNFTQDELARIPNSRDPWALLRTVPGVTMDRVNIAGNETGQQSEFMGKGTRRFEASWTLDGVVITDMAATGASPTYFDYDAFEEIQISTAGHDIRQPSGGVGLNLVVKRGTNQWRGTARGYFTNDSLQSENVPDELLGRGVTPDTADRNDQISDYGFDLSGPIVRDRAWFYAGWTEQDIRLFRQAGSVIDRTILRTTNIKGNWQATRSHLISVLWFNGVKDKFGRATGQAQFEPESARWNQGGAYPENRPRGLLKFQDDWVISPRNFMSLKYAYYGTGFSLAPAGGMDMQAGISARLGRTFGSTQDLRFLRPQQMANADGNTFFSALGAGHDIAYGVGYRRHDAFSGTRWPGDMVVGMDDSETVQRARLYREGAGTNRTEYFSLYVGDTMAFDRLTVNAGLRYDRQWGSALPSQTSANIAFPELVPGVDFAGYRSPFTWNNFSPRFGVTYALDDARKTLLRTSWMRFSGGVDSTIVGYMNPSAQVGWVEYPWTDLNGDNLVQPNEVNIAGGVQAFGGGFNPANPTSVESANRIDPDLKPSVSDNFVLGLDRELIPNLGIQVAYTYTRTRDLAEWTPWRGVGPEHYIPGAVLTGTLPDGTGYSVPTFLPDAAAVAAGGGGRFLTNYPGYRTTYHGVELSMVKRMADRWMARVATSWNNPREFYDVQRNVQGNPTSLDTWTLQSGGQFAQRSFGSGAGDIFMNARWQFNANAAYQLPWNLEVAGNLFGRHGNPHPIWHLGNLGRDGNQRVLVSTTLDQFRYDNVWNLDLRLAHYLRFNNRITGQIAGDLFNVFNSNVELQRERHILSPNFNRLNQNLSPRIFRIGVRLGF
jgi:hypothetical protein